MPISSLSLLESATITPSGGTALPFILAGSPVNDAVKAYASGDTDLRTRRSIHFSVKEPKVSATAPNGYTQARAQVYIKIPFSLDNGLVTTHSVRIEFAYDAEATQAEVLEMRKIACQAIIDSDLDEFYNNLSLA